MCFWSVSEAFLAWGQLSEVTGAPLALSSLYSLHTHLALSSPLTLHLYALSLRRLTLSQLLPSRAGARMLACVCSLSLSLWLIAPIVVLSLCESLFTLPQR